MTTDEALVALIAAGDADAGEQLFRRHYAEVRALCARISGDVSSADDLVQETFLRVMRFASGFKAKSTVRTWLYRIAFNVSADHRKRSARRPPEIVQDRTEPSPDPRLELIERGLARLPEAQRQVLLLSRHHDLTHAQLGDILNCSEGTARVRVHRALVELKRIVHELEAADDEL
jgi:RNA polymerase sigma-70 factor (ECF subfamily)